MGYFKTMLGLETPEAGNSPIITGDLKKLAEQIDGLLRKQLVATVELATLEVATLLETKDLVVTSAMEFPAGSITAGDLAVESVTDAKVVKGRALVETENIYSTLGAKALGTEYEPSATRLTFVVLTATQKATWSLNVFVGGIEIAALLSEPSGTQTDYRSITFPVPPGRKWKATSTEGAPVVYASYLTL